jgi:hypothetical protein
VAQGRRGLEARPPHCRRQRTVVGGPRRVERGQRGVLAADDNGDLGTTEDDRLGAARRDPFDRPQKWGADGRVEPPPAQCVKDQPVEDLLLFRVGDDGLDVGRREPSRIDVARHRPAGAEQAHPGETAAPSLDTRHIGDVQTRQWQLAHATLQHEVGFVIRTDEELRPGTGQDANRPRPRGTR